MMNEYIKTLDYLISETHVAVHRNALVAARNRLEEDQRRYYAGIRQPSDWPYCAECGKAYRAVATEYMYVRSVEPVCKCHAGIVWQGRPVDNGWEYLIDRAALSEAAASWERFLERGESA